MENTLTPLKPNIPFEDFTKVQMAVGLITEVIKVPKKDRLYQLKVSFGFSSLGERIVVSSIAHLMSVDELLNKKTLFVINFEPVEICKIKSEAMIILAQSPTGGLCLTAPYDAEPGSLVN